MVSHTGLLQSRGLQTDPRGAALNASGVRTHAALRRRRRPPVRSLARRSLAAFEIVGAHHCSWIPGRSSSSPALSQQPLGRGSPARGESTALRRADREQPGGQPGEPRAPGGAAHSGASSLGRRALLGCSCSTRVQARVQADRRGRRAAWGSMSSASSADRATRLPPAGAACRCWRAAAMATLAKYKCAGAARRNAAAMPALLGQPPLCCRRRRCCYVYRPLMPFNMSVGAGSSSWATSRWARRASSRASCTTSSTPRTRYVARGGPGARWPLLLPQLPLPLLTAAAAADRCWCLMCCLLPPCLPACATRPPSASTSCPRRCTWRTALCGCSCGACRLAGETAAARWARPAVVGAVGLLPCCLLLPACVAGPADAPPAAASQPS